MPKLPRISGEQAIAVLKGFGFVPVRQKGSHIVLRYLDRGCVVPMHKELAVGTLRSILRQAGVAVEAFVEAYQKDKSY